MSGVNDSLRVAALFAVRVFKHAEVVPVSAGACYRADGQAAHDRHFSRPRANGCVTPGAAIVRQRPSIDIHLNGAAVGVGAKV